jgi:hypothetical protein
MYFVAYFLEKHSNYLLKKHYMNGPFNGSTVSFVRYEPDFEIFFWIHLRLHRLNFKQHAVQELCVKSHKVLNTRQLKCQYAI